MKMVSRLKWSSRHSAPDNKILVFFLRLGAEEEFTVEIFARC